MSCTHTVVLIRRDHPPGASKYPLMLQEVLFKPLLRWMSDALYAAGGRSVRIIRDDLSLDAPLLRCFAPQWSDIALLDANASDIGRTVLSYLSGGAEETLFITAPALLTGRTVASLCQAHASGDNLLTELLADDEHPTGLYCLTGAAAAGTLFSYLDRRFDLPDACRRMTADDIPLGSFFVSDSSGGAVRVQNTQALQMARQTMQSAVVERHMRQGVAVLDPSSAVISSEAVIGRDTTLLPGVVIQGETVIGEDCVIGPFTVLNHCAVGDRCTINASQLYDSRMGSDVKVGPYAYVRPNCVLGSRIKIGDFVELKNAHIGSGTKVPHLSYVGDSDVGEGVNIGCGSITVNYDGKKKHRTVVENGAFIGCNSNLVSPVTVGQNAYTAAGSTITGNVPPGALGIARARQVNKEGWAEKKNK